MLNSLRQYESIALKAVMTLKIAAASTLANSYVLQNFTSKASKHLSIIIVRSKFYYLIRL